MIVCRLADIMEDGQFWDPICWDDDDLEFWLDSDSMKSHESLGEFRKILVNYAEEEDDIEMPSDEVRLQQEGLWILDLETLVYKRQFVGEDMNGMIFDLRLEYEPYRKFVRCSEKGIVGVDFLEFESLEMGFFDWEEFDDLRDWLDGISKSRKAEIESLKKQLEVAQLRFSTLKKGVENLSLLPGMSEYEKAQESFEELKI